MPWTKIDDQFYDHPKVVAAGPLGVALFVCSLSYCARHLTDGFITATQAKRLIDVGDPLVVAEQLVTVGLWERRDGGYQVHDYLEYNPSAAQVKAQRAANAERQARWRGKQEPEVTETGEDDGDNSNGVNNSASNIAPSPIPSPIPDPIPEPTNTDSPATPAAQAPVLIPKPRTKRQKKPQKAPTEKQRTSRVMFGALAAVCQIDLTVLTDAQRGALNQSERKLRSVASPDDVGEFAEWWPICDWRGQKGQAPQPHQVRETWGQFVKWRDNGKPRPYTRDGKVSKPVERVPTPISLY